MKKFVNTIWILFHIFITLSSYVFLFITIVEIAKNDYDENLIFVSIFSVYFILNQMIHIYKYETSDINLPFEDEGIYK